SSRLSRGTRLTRWKPGTACSWGRRPIAPSKLAAASRARTWSLSYASNVTCRRTVGTLLRVGLPIRGHTVTKIPPGVGPRFPQVVVFFGATGDLSHRKLLPGLFSLSSTGFIPNCRIVGVSLDELNADGFRDAARKALDEFSPRPVNDPEWQTFAR